MFGLFKKEDKKVEVIDNDDGLIKLETLNGTVYAKKIVHVDGKHVIYVDQYGNVKEAFVK